MNTAEISGRLVIEYVLRGKGKTPELAIKDAKKNAKVTKFIRDCNPLWEWDLKFYYKLLKQCK